MLCLDTMILIWGVRGVAEVGQEAMIGHARAYVQYLWKENDRVMVPAVVLAEYLHGAPSDGAARAELAVFTKRFAVMPFDARCAQIAGEIMRSRSQPLDGTRTCIKADCQIVATAIAHGARAIVSYDSDMESLAGSRIKVIQMPEIAHQPALIDE